MIPQVCQVKRAIVNFGGGPVVIMMDATSIAHQGLRKHIKDVAKEHNIEVQWDTTPGGGTDAGSIMRK